jgi:D-threonate/D-erythronate kinase
MSDFFLADDLSGALDAAAAFHHAGRRVRIVWSLDAWDAALPDEVVGFTTETRNARPAEAAAVVGGAIAHGFTRGRRLLYKKIDSTLRGPVAAEVNAVATAWPEARILFCPANPAVGRTVRDGILLVRGVPVAETEFARDPASPVRESVIMRLLGPEFADRISVPDAVTDDDLARAVAAMDAQRQPWVAVGSGALARPVAARFRRAREEISPASSPPIAGGGVLFVCGSAHPGNREQAAVLGRTHGVLLHELRVTDPVAAAGAAIATINTRGTAALMLEAARGNSARTLEAVATATEMVIRSAQVRRLFVTGGETTFRLCAALGINSLEFSAELEPGLILARGRALSGEMALAVKPGGFGDGGTWLRAWDALMQA